MATNAAAPAAPQVPTIDDYEVVLPDGLTVEQLAAAAAGELRSADAKMLDELAGGPSRRAPAVPVATAAPPAEPPPAAPAPAAITPPPTPGAPPKPSGTPAPPGVLKERERRKAAEAEAARLQRDLEEANERSRQMQADLKRQQAAAAATPTRITLTDAELAKLRADADKAEDQGKAAELGVRFALEKVNAAFQDVAQRTAPVAAAPTDIQALEDAFAQEHPDYDEMLYKAGIFRAIEVNPQTRQARNPGLHEKIFKQANPVEYAYKLAKQILRQRGQLKDEESPAEGEAVETAAAAATAAAAPNGNGTPQAAPTAEALAEAERRGAARATAEITNQAEVRGRGMRAVPNAGGPTKAKIDKRFLDDLMFRNYDAYLKLIESNPQLEYEHMSAG